MTIPSYLQRRYLRRFSTARLIMRLNGLLMKLWRGAGRKMRIRPRGVNLKESLEEREENWLRESNSHIDLVAFFVVEKVFVEDPEIIMRTHV